jgi:hypothetical protein
MTFDPDATAIAAGEGHLVPRTIRRLSADEIHAWYPTEFHLLRGRSTCGCPEKTRAVARVLPPVLGGIEL